MGERAWTRTGRSTHQLRDGGSLVIAVCGRRMVAGRELRELRELVDVERLPLCPRCWKSEPPVIVPIDEEELKAKLLDLERRLRNGGGSTEARYRLPYAA